MKKHISLLLVFTMLLTLAACGKENPPVVTDDSSDEIEAGEDEEPVSDEVVIDAKSELARENAYKVTEIDTGFDTYNFYVEDSGITDDGAYFILGDYNSELPEFRFIELDDDGSVIDKILLSDAIDHDFSNIFNILNKNRLNPEALNSPIFTGFTLNNDGNIECCMTVLLGFTDGSEKFAPFEITWDRKGDCIGVDYIPLLLTSVGYINEFFIEDNGDLIILYSDYADDGDDPYNEYFVAVFDGNRKKKLSVKGYDVRDWLYGFQRIYSYDGKIYVYSYDYDDGKYYLSQVNPDTLKLSEKKEISLDNLETLTNIGISEDGELIFSNNNCLKKSDGSKNDGKFLDFINSDFKYGFIFDFVSIEGTDKFYGTGYDDSIKIFMFEHREPEELPVNKVITLGYDSSVQSIAGPVYDFNTADNGCRIVGIDISDYPGSFNDGNIYETYEKKIVSGEMPDILYVNADCGIDFRFLAEEGYLADVENLINEDSELDMNDFCTNVFDAARINNKLYFAVPFFGISTFYGSKNYVGDYDNWTVDEFIEYSDGLDDDSTIFNPYYNRFYFMSECIQFSGYLWIDKDFRFCDFNDPSFMKLVGYYQSLPQDTDFESERFIDYMEDSVAFGRDGRYRINKGYGYSFDIFYRDANYTFDSPAKITGFPTSDKKGSAIILENIAVLNASSDDLDTAWSFVKLLFGKEYQSGNDYRSFPVLKSALREDADSAAEADNEVSKDDAESLYRILTTTDRLCFTDGEIITLVYSVVNEGTDKGKTPEEIATDVQKSVSDYLSEK